MSKVRVGALQLGSTPDGTAATLEKIVSYAGQIRDEALGLVVMPEALLGGYPKGEGFGTLLGYRQQEGREAYARYFAEAITIPGPEIDELTELSSHTGTMLVVGVIERDGSTLYCTQIYLDPEHGYIGKHRKLMPTGTERLIWGQGGRQHTAGCGHENRQNRWCHLLGTLHAALAHRHVREGRGDLGSKHC